MSETEKDTIPLTYFRSSSISSHDMCEMKFFLEYILGWEGPPNFAASKGTVLHKIMEILAISKKLQQDNNANLTDITKQLDAELNYWIESDPTSIDIQELTNTVYDLYSNKLTHHDWTDATRREIHRWVKKTLELNNGYFDPRLKDIVEPEHRFTLPIKEDWAKLDDGTHLTLRGTIDLITKIDDNTYEIIDWKTGRARNWAEDKDYTWESLHDNMQLRLYHYAVTQLYPNIRDILVTIVYINHKGAFTIPFDRSHIPDTLDYIHKKYERIKNNKPTRIWDTDKAKSRKCTSFCHYGCSTFKDTSIEPLVEFRHNAISQPTTLMTKCDQTNYCLTHRSLKSVMNNMSKDKHDLTKYSEPGKIIKP